MHLNESIEIATDAMDSTRTIGVELELHSYDNNQLFHRLHDELNNAGLDTTINLYSHRGGNPNGWHIKNDGTGSEYSIREIVSPPLKSVDMVKQLHLLLFTLHQVSKENIANGGRGFAVNVKCGLHVHHCGKKYLTSRGARNYKKFKYLVQHFVKNEQNFDSMVSESRRHNINSFCGTNAGRLDSNIDSLIDDYNFRYAKLNLHSFAGHKTIEIRSHQGTLNFAKIVYWLAFTQALVIRAERKVTRTVSAHQAPMIDYMLASGWGSHYKPAGRVVGGFLPKNEACERLCLYILNRVIHFGVQRSFVLHSRADVEGARISHLEVNAGLSLA